MKNWKDLFHQPIRKEHEDRVFQAVEADLETLAGGQRRSRWAFLAALGTAAAAITVWMRTTPDPSTEELDLLAVDDELLNDMEFFDELENLEDWDEQSDS